MSTLRNIYDSSDGRFSISVDTCLSYTEKPYRIQIDQTNFKIITNNDKIEAICVEIEKSWIDDCGFVIGKTNGLGIIVENKKYFLTTPPKNINIYIAKNGQSYIVIDEINEKNIREIGFKY